MIELRSLAYFVASCRSETLAAAATGLGIALSTLSAALKALEQEFGLALFERLPTGLGPTADALWLVRAAEPLLACEAFAGCWSAAPQPRPAQILTLDIDLNFTLGRVGAAIRQAAAAMATTRPEVLVNAVWGEDRAGPRDDPPVAWPGARRHRLALTLAGGRGPRQDGDTTIEDRWVFACRVPAAMDRPASAAELAAGRIVVPALRPPLLGQADRYFRRHGIGGVRFLGEPPGDLARLIADHPDAAVFVPASVVSPRLGLARVRAIAADPPLASGIVLRAATPNAVTRQFTRHLARAFAAPAPTIERPRISLRQIHYFCMVHRLRRVSAAAHGANVSQPALSDQLRKLEAMLGTALFARRGDGVVPTVPGERFAAVAALIEAGHRRITARSAAAAPLGRIALGILPSVSQHGLLVNRIAEAVLEVQARRPGLRLVIREAPNGTLQDWVTRGLVGVAIVETGLPHMPRLPLGSSEGLAAVAHPEHALLPPGPVRFVDLVRLPLALPTRRFGLRQLLEMAAEERGIRIRPQMEIDSLTMAAALLARMPVCAVLPPSAVRRELAAGEFVAHPIVDPEIARRLFVIHSGERALSAPERDLVNTLRKRLLEATDME